MSIALMAALLGSLIIHAGILLGTDYELFGKSREQPALQAVLRVAAPAPAPAVAPASVTASPLPARDALRPVKPPRAELPASIEPAPVVEISAVSEIDTAIEPENRAEMADFLPSTAVIDTPVDPVLPAQGYLRFAVIKTSLGLEIGRAEHRWEFPGDGSYRLTNVLETSGLAALLKPVRQQYESAGRLGAGGLQPETFRTLKNGQPTRENADFDWSTGEVSLTRNGSVQRIAAGSQDILSLNYQLAYLPAPENGATIGVVTGRKYEKHALDSLGEEVIETPAGRFRTLHLRAAGETLTEIWIALDHGRLPVKIRFTDKKGDSFEQIATELGVGDFLPQPD